MRRAACTALVATVLGGCAVGPPLAVDATRAPDLPSLARLGDCGWQMAPVVDARANGARAGDVARRTVSVADLAARVERQLVAAGMPIAGTTAPDVIRVEITSAYGYSKSTSRAFTTVLVAHHRDERIIGRGSNTGLNWASGDDELARGLLGSADAAVRDLTTKLASRCGV